MEVHFSFHKFPAMNSAVNRTTIEFFPNNQQNNDISHDHYFLITVIHTFGVRQCLIYLSIILYLNIICHMHNTQSFLISNTKMTDMAIQLYCQCWQFTKNSNGNANFGYQVTVILLYCYCYCYFFDSPATLYPYSDHPRKLFARS